MRNEDKRMVWWASLGGFVVLLGFLTTSFFAWVVFGLAIPFYRPQVLYVALAVLWIFLGYFLGCWNGWRKVGDEEGS